MSLHKEINFETEICEYLAANGWLYADGDAANNADVDISAPDRRHGGDLLGIVQRMPYLQDLGVTTLWITPVYTNPPEAYHGIAHQGKNQAHGAV